MSASASLSSTASACEKGAVTARIVAVTTPKRT
jgi:hypothetical protein